jgi:hypothetical protein
MKFAITAFTLLLTAHYNLSIAADPQEAAKLFQAGVVRLEEKKNAIFGGGGTTSVDIEYDVKKTDSVIQPIIGVLVITENTGSAFHLIHHITFSFSNDAWTATKYTRTITTSAGSDDYDEKLSSRPVPQVQECFK